MFAFNVDFIEFFHTINIQFHYFIYKGRLGIWVGFGFRIGKLKFVNRLNSYLSKVNSIH